MDSAFRWRSGTHAVVDVTTAYLVSLLALQNDQSVALGWRITATPLLKPRYRTSLGQTIRGDGYWQQDFTLTMTYGMYKYIRTNFLTVNGDYGNITIMTYDEENDATFLTGVLMRPDSSQLENSQKSGGYEKVTFPFRKGVIIT